MENLRDLHAHITGSIDAASVFDIISSENLYRTDKEKIDSLTEAFGMKLASEMEKDLAGAKRRFGMAYPCHPNGKIDFSGIMQRFVLTAYLINRVPQAEEKMGYAVANKFKQQGVSYVEWRVDPFSATDGQTAEEGLAKLHGFYDGLKKVKGLESGLVLSIAKSRYGRDWKPIPERIDYLEEQMKKLLEAETGLPIVGLDAVNKDEVKIADLKKVLGMSDRYGLVLVPHVGELAAKNLETDLENVECAVKLGAKRLGHAIAAYMPLENMLNTNDNLGQNYGAKRIRKLAEKQEKILSLLSREDVAVEVCPTSNMAAHLGLMDYKAHPVDVLHKNNVPFVVCTDDYGIFGSPLSKELELMRVIKGMDEKVMLDNSKRYSIDCLRCRT